MWPLPPSVDSTLCYSSIPASQDVDGLVPGSPTLPVTAAAALTLLASRSVEVKGGDCVVVGRSRIAGKPLAEALGDMGATVTLAHTSTKRESLERAVRGADLVVSAAGEPGVVDGGWIKEGAVVISVGKVFDEDEEKFMPDMW